MDEVFLELESAVSEVFAFRFVILSHFELRSVPVCLSVVPALVALVLEVCFQNRVVRPVFRIRFRLRFGSGFLSITDLNRQTAAVIVCVLF